MVKRCGRSTVDLNLSEAGLRQSDSNMIQSVQQYDVRRIKHIVSYMFAIGFETVASGSIFPSSVFSGRGREQTEAGLETAPLVTRSSYTDVRAVY